MGIARVAIGPAPKPGKSLAKPTNKRGSHTPRSRMRQYRRPSLSPPSPTSSRTIFTIESPYVMPASGLVQLGLSAMRDARRIRS